MNEIEGFLRGFWKDCVSRYDRLIERRERKRRQEIRGRGSIAFEIT